MRRALLLIAGLGMGFCMFWLLLSNAGIALAQQQASQPVLLLQTETAKVAEEITLPFAVEGTSLVAVRLALYDGPFLEDGTNEEVMNVAALELRNTADCGIAKACVILERGEVRLVFEADTIPAGGTVLVLEKNGKALGEKTFSAYSGWAIPEDGDWTAAGLVGISDVDMGTVAVTNITYERLYNIRLYYKNFLPQSDLYIGGNTYEISIDCLEPGQTVLLTPSHYASGYSRVVRISVEGAR